MKNPRTERKGPKAPNGSTDNAACRMLSGPGDLEGNDLAFGARDRSGTGPFGSDKIASLEEELRDWRRTAYGTLASFDERLDEEIREG